MCLCGYIYLIRMSQLPAAFFYTFGQRRTFDNNNNYATKTQHYFFKLDTLVVFECIVQTQS